MYRENQHPSQTRRWGSKINMHPINKYTSKNVIMKYMYSQPLQICLSTITANFQISFKLLTKVGQGTKLYMEENVNGWTGHMNEESRQK